MALTRLARELKNDRIYEKTIACWGRTIACWGQTIACWGQTIVFLVDSLANRANAIRPYGISRHRSHLERKRGPNGPNHHR